MKDTPIPAPSGLRPEDSAIRKWIVAARLPFLTASVMPVLAATAAAWRAEGVLRPGLATLALVGVALVHAGANLANDYFDHLSGNDLVNRLVTPYSGGSRVIQEGILSAREIVVASIACLVAGGYCGIALWLMTPGYTLLAIGVAGVAIAWFYTAPPVRLAHRGLGELGVGVGFGLLPVLGAEYVQRGALSLQVGWTGLPAALLVAAILLANEFPDIEADGSVGKRTLVVRLGHRRSATLYAALAVGAYVAVLVGVLAGWMPVLALIVVLAAPFTWRAIRVLRAHGDDVRALVPGLAATVAQHAVFLLLLAGAYLADLALGAR